MVWSSVERNVERSRGANDFGPPVISPDGTQAWVPSKQDNGKRGMLRKWNVTLVVATMWDWFEDKLVRA